MTPDQFYDAMSWIAIGITCFVSVGTVWIWRLVYSPDNTPPRSRLLYVLAVKNTLVTIACWGISSLAVVRLSGNSIGALGGIMLVFILMLLMSVNIITITYLWLVRRRRSANGVMRPPPFGSDD